MSNRIIIPLPNGYNLIAEQNADPNYRNEIFIGLTDKNNVWYQDLAIVRNASEFSNNKIEWKNDEMEVLVYSDENNEDFTHDFSIGVRCESV